MGTTSREQLLTRKEQIINVNLCFACGIVEYITKSGGHSMFYSLNGIWQADIGDGKNYPVNLPGTLDENQIGHRDVSSGKLHPDEALGNNETLIGQKDVITTRFTRQFTYEGEARFTRQLSFNPPEGKRVFLEVERARCLKLLIDGREVPDFVEPSISTPHIYEVTGRLNGENECTLVSDNSYPGLPYHDIIRSSAATDETQTNWNGVLGFFRLRVEESVFLQAVRVYPSMDTVMVRLEVSASEYYVGSVTIVSDAFEEDVVRQIEVFPGISEIVLDNLLLKRELPLWEEGEGNLYEMTASLSGKGSKKVSFGVRTFGDDGNGRLAINGRTIFLRSEANCAEFPEEGHTPMEVERWTEILKMYQSYGVNCMRFHSWCPPEAAFTAADSLGMMMQPELSHWNSRSAFETEESYRYYQTELRQILYTFANHPSFVMLTFGNELGTKELGHSRMSTLLELAHELDSTRLYANGSNVHYGRQGCDAGSDFYTSFRFYDSDLRGTFGSGTSEPGTGIEGYLNNRYPNAKNSYDDTMNRIREVYQKPVFSFEVGEFEILPDFDELAAFHGISDPENIRFVEERVREKGLLPRWKEYVEASGKLAEIGYREEIEAAMRTEQLSGISLLGLQDFPGQGTALVGMMNSHLHSKPYNFARPEAFCAFFREQLPLVFLPKYTYDNCETLGAEVKVANYGKKKLAGDLKYKLAGEGICLSGVLTDIICPIGKLTYAGTLNLSLETIKKASRLDLTVEIEDIRNIYPIWVYPPVLPVCPSSVYETKRLDERAVKILESGGTVYLTPDASKEALPHSIQTQFTTDFWSVGTFPGQEGGMGQLIDVSHPIFDEFPTESHTNWQWWPMATQRAVVLPELYEAIVTEMDSYAYLRHMAQLLECRCGNGRLLLSTMGLQNLQQYPEARALLNAIYQYLDSEKFAPRQEIEVEVIRALVV